MTASYEISLYKKKIEDLESKIKDVTDQYVEYSSLVAPLLDLFCECVDNLELLVPDFWESPLGKRLKERALDALSKSVNLGEIHE